MPLTLPGTAGTLARGGGKGRDPTVSCPRVAACPGTCSALDPRRRPGLRPLLPDATSDPLGDWCGSLRRPAVAFEVSGKLGHDAVVETTMTDEDAAADQGVVGHRDHLRAACMHEGSVGWGMVS